MKSIVYAGLFVALIAVTGARDVPAASAPAANAPGAAPENVADLLFVLSANQAEFPDSHTLRLTGVASTAQFYGAGAKAGVLMTPLFANASSGAAYVASDGQWLNNPSAALIGDVNSSASNQAVLLSLGSPTYDAATQSVSFNVSILEPTEDVLKTKGGVANELVAERANGAGTPLITAVTPGAAMTNVALFIDANRAALKANAATETWWLFCGPWCGGWGGGWGGWGGGWGGGGWGWGR